MAKGYSSAIYPNWVLDLIESFKNPFISMISAQLDLIGYGFLWRSHILYEGEYVLPVPLRQGRLTGKELLPLFVRWQDAIQYRLYKKNESCLLGGQYRLVIASPNNPHYEENKIVCLPVHKDKMDETQTNDSIFDQVLNEEPTPLTSEEKKILEEYAERKKIEAKHFLREREKRGFYIPMDDKDGKD